MMNFLRSLVVLLLTMGILLLASCVNPIKTLRDADYNITENQKHVQRVQWRSTVSAPAVKSYSGYYVNSNPIERETPSWAGRKIVVQAEKVPMDFLVARILRDTPAAVNFQPDVERKQLLSMHYSGTIKGALDQLAANTNYGYEFQGNTVAWKAFLTKTFDVSFMPGSSAYQVGQNEGRGAGEGVPTNNVSGGAGGTSIMTVSGDLGAQQYSNLKGNLSVWQDLRQALNELKSQEGRYYVSESTTSVTITDHPANVKAIEDYIRKLNRDLTREVAIQVEVLQIQLDKAFNYGIDWNVVAHTLGTQIALKAPLGSTANIAAAATQGIGSANGLAVFSVGQPGGNQTLINALSQQGRVSVVTQPRVVTINNQMAEIKITRDVSYLQSVSNTTVANAGNASNTTTLTPGIVTDGFTLFLLPKIQDQRVYMQISSVLSTLTAISTVSNNGTINQPVNQNNSNPQSQFQAIQVPTLSNQTFNQRTVVNSGSTLIIAGFQQLRDDTTRSQLLGIQPLGGIGADHRNTQTIVLITPTILGKF